MQLWKSILVRVSARFELVRVQVIKGISSRLQRGYFDTKWEIHKEQQPLNTESDVRSVFVKKNLIYSGHAIDTRGI